MTATKEIKMDEDDIDSVNLRLNVFLEDSLGVSLNDEEYDLLRDFLYDQLDPFLTKERNYN